MHEQLANLAPTTARERRLEQLGLAGRDDGWIDRYMVCEHLADLTMARARQRFEALARFSRDLIAQRWMQTRRDRERANPKRIYYLLLESAGRCATTYKIYAESFQNADHLNDIVAEAQRIVDASPEH